MPTPRQSERRMRSKSPSRKTSKSRSRSRSRGRARSKSPARKAKQSPSPTRRPRQTKEEKPKPNTPPRQSRRNVTPSVSPSRQSARLIQKAQDKEFEEKQGEGDAKEIKQKEKAAKKPVEESKYEFGGPIGALAVIVGLPLMVVLYNLACTKASCSYKSLPKDIPTKLEKYFDRNTVLIFLGWIVFQTVLAIIPIGPVVNGTELRSGKKLKYRCNGLLALIATCLAYGGLVYGKKTTAFTYVYEHYLQLAVTSIVFSFLLSIYLYASSQKLTVNTKAPRGNTGNAIYDFFAGRELNPRIGSFDLKFFFELRPGLIGWFVLNLIFITVACLSVKKHPSHALSFVGLSQCWYVADALFFESSILTTMDIVHDGFGFMLAFGDIAWVPFMYSLQTRYLLEHPQQWSNAAIAGFILLFLVGYAIFRGSNSQKDKFRRNPFDPSLAHLETIPSQVAGKPLLASGWWGLVRHPNYLGDLIMALSWSLPCGSNPLMYFYPVYFLILLVHRSLRDDANCRKKHGAAWERYCLRVKYRIIPYVF